MSDQNSCGICRRRARIIDSVLCESCASSTLETSLAMRNRQAGSGGVIRSARDYRAAAYGT